MAADVTLPEGFVLDQLPEGFKLDPPKSRLDKTLDVLRQGIPGGPVGMAAALGKSGMDEFSEALERGAYKAGGAVTDLTGSPALGFAANVGIQAVPTVLGGEAAKLTSPALRKGAEVLMQSALKPSAKALKQGTATQAISTLLEEGINVTKGGVAKLRGMISQLNDDIAEAIKNSPGTVNKAKAGSELHDLVKKFEKQVNPGADIKAIENAWTEFLGHPLLQGVKEIPVKLAQEMKQATYKELAKKYGEMGSAATEAQKTLARGLKEGIAEAVPEVAGLNAKESALIKALQLAEHRAMMDGNKNVGGLAWLAGNPGAFAAFMADKSALFKSVVARMLNAGKEQIPATAGRVGAAAATAATQN